MQPSVFLKRYKKGKNLHLKKWKNFWGKKWRGRGPSNLAFAGRSLKNGATALSITTLRITTLSIPTLNVTVIKCDTLQNVMLSVTFW